MKKITFPVYIILSILICTFSASAQWEQVLGVSGGNVSCLADSGSNIFTGTYQRGVLVSNDNGNSWAEINNGLGTDTFILSIAIRDSNIFTGTSGHGVFRSSNGGTSWTAANNGLSGYGIVSLVINDTNIFAGTLVNGVFLSSDNGASWKEVNNGLKDSIISSLTISGSNIFAGTFGGGVFLSTDNGSSWTAVNNGITDSVIYCLTASGSNIFAGTLNGSVFLSSNNGSSWTAVDSGLPKTTGISLAASGSNIFAGTNERGVYLTTNNGSTWTAVNSGLTVYPGCLITSLAVNDSYIYAGTQSNENGVWRRSLSEVLAVENIRQSKSISIYPNPASKELRISYDGNRERVEKAVIFNVLGEMIYTQQPETGNMNKETRIDVSALPSGIYFVEVIYENDKWLGKFVKE